MDNIETTETKKKIKIGISDIIVFVILVIILGFFIYLTITDSELFLFGYVWKINDIGNFFNMISAAVVFMEWKGQPKSAKRRNVMILCAVLFIFEIGLISWSAYDNINEKVDRERLILSDGKEVMLSERIDYSKLSEGKLEFTYMDVYQINGIAAKNLGKINESYFSNKCLLQDKYTYEYDEASKKLTVICEHGSASLEEQNGTGFWSKEFLLE